MGAILNSPGQKLTLQEIYNWIQDAFPYYAKIDKTCWQNSIRHNLRSNKAFYRKKKNNGKGSVWRIDSNHSEGVLKSTCIKTPKLKTFSSYNVFAAEVHKEVI